MKQWLAIAGLGVGLFAVAIVGTLAIQGRLDHDGTRGIPLLEQLFADTGDPAKPAAPTVVVPAAPAGETAPPAAGEPAAALVREPFQLPELSGALKVEDIESMLRAAEVRDRASRDRAAAVAQRERELALRQRDLEDREAAVADKMLEVDRERERLEARIAQFEKDVLMVHRDDVRALRDYAHTLAALDPERAAAVLEREWQDEAGRKRITRALALLDAEEVGAILGQVPADRTREVLLERLKVVREQ